MSSLHRVNPWRLTTIGLLMALGATALWAAAGIYRWGVDHYYVRQYDVSVATAGTASSTVTLSWTAKKWRVVNTGTVDVYVLPGAASVTSSTGLVVLANGELSDDDSYVDQMAIMSSSSSVSPTVRIEAAR